MDTIQELHKYECYVINKEYEKAYKQLIVLLKNTSIHRKKVDQIFDRLNEREVAYVAARIISTTFQLFLDKGFLLSEDGYRSLSVFGRNFHVMLMLTPFYNADHVMRHLLGHDEEGNQQENINIYEFRKLFFLWSVYSDVKLPLSVFFRDHPRLSYYALFNALTLNSYIAKASHLRRVVFSYLQNKEAVTELFREISAKVIDREGGYTRIIPLGNRRGDNARLAYLELTEIEEVVVSKPTSTASAKKKDLPPTKQEKAQEKPKGKVKESSETDIKDLLEQIGFAQHLTPSRVNGFFSVVERIKKYCCSNYRARRSCS